jgi:hypothetical protein
MSVLPNQIPIAELDYDQILQNLVTFIKADPAFSDYDFAGAGLRVLERMLAYVTFYNAYYLTSAVNESFLDTAQLRTSVASHARMLGYDIRGTLSARATANVVVQLDNTNSLVVSLPKNTPFSLVANNGYTFYNVADVELDLNANTNLYEAPNVPLVEGQPLQYRFTVNLSDPTQRFIIPNANIDYSTITVQVQASNSSNVTTQFFRNTNFLTIDGTDPVFFVQEGVSGFPELRFGNGVVGKALVNGNIIVADYYVSKGSVGNNIRGPFKILTANVAGFVQGTTVTDGNTAPSTGGADSESLDSARFLAPLSYQAQNRCVTADDYKTVVLQTVGESVGAINVFGGEQGDPNDPAERPVPGKVFIVLKPVIGLRFTDIARLNIQQNIIQPRSIVGVIPEVIDPDYIFLNISTSVKYDPKATTLTKLQLQNEIRDSILTFARDSIEKFDTSFRFSKFTRVIDDSDEAIVSSLTRIDLEKRIFPETGGVSQHFVLKFGAPLRKNGTDSAILEAQDHRFTYQNDAGDTKDRCFFYEQAGQLHVAYRDATNQIVVFQKNVGTVDTTRGVVTVSNFAPLRLENDVIDVRIRALPNINDFVPHLNQLYTIDPAEITIQVLNDATATQSDLTSFFQGGVLPN